MRSNWRSSIKMSCRAFSLFKRLSRSTLGYSPGRHLTRHRSERLSSVSGRPMVSSMRLRRQQSPPLSSALLRTAQATIRRCFFPAVQLGNGGTTGKKLRLPVPPFGRRLITRWNGFMPKSVSLSNTDLRPVILTAMWPKRNPSPPMASWSFSSRGTLAEPRSLPILRIPPSVFSLGRLLRAICGGHTPSLFGLPIRETLRSVTPVSWGFAWALVLKAKETMIRPRSPQLPVRSRTPARRSNWPLRSTVESVSA